jgi:UDP-4-amino-4,6-dideoxy-N-acetyl-beta-L-altrosamine N-acetyltransferase
MIDYENFSIRLIDQNDKELILSWRNSERVRCNMYSDHLITQKEHDTWFSKALVDISAVYLLFLYMERPIGFISFTHIDKIHQRCFWAFYLGEVDVPRGSGSVMEYFALDYAYMTLKIRKLCAEVFIFNSTVIRLHEKFGFIEEGRFVAHYLKNGQYEDIVCIARFMETWLDDRKIFQNRIFGKANNRS